MIEVFKTNVQTKTQAKRIVKLLHKDFSEAGINFDLHDRDKILRVAGIKRSHTQTIINHVNQFGFACEMLN
jgi:tRNA G26 N,N-dimethylase Trm1